MRSFLLFLCCICSLVVAGYLGHSVFLDVFTESEINAKGNKPFHLALTLNRRFEPGDILSEKDIIWLKKMPHNILPENITREEFARKGHHFFSLAKGNQAGQVLVESQVVWPDDASYLAKTLQAGYRAISVPFEAEEGILSTLHPGSRLDVVHTITSNGITTDTSLSPTTVIASNVRVLQIGSEKQTEKSVNVSSNRRSIRNIVLEVRLAQVNAISSARLSGILIPALRATSDKSTDLETETILSNLHSEKTSLVEGNVIFMHEKQGINTLSEFRQIFIQRRDERITEVRKNHVNLNMASKMIRGPLTQ